MSQNGASNEKHVATLIELVERDRRERCALILSEAEAQARQIERAARRDATRRVLCALREERERCDRRVEAMRAELATKARKRGRDRSSELVARAWHALEVELERRWQIPEARAHWIRAALERALGLFPKGSWQIAHPSDFRASELGPLEARIVEAAGSPPRLVPQSNLRAGLRISSAGVVLDAALEGLCADRSLLEGRLLAELARDGDGGGA